MLDGGLPCLQVEEGKGEGAYVVSIGKLTRRGHHREVVELPFHRRLAPKLALVVLSGSSCRGVRVAVCTSAARSQGAGQERGRRQAEKRHQIGSALAKLRRDCSPCVAWLNRGQKKDSMSVCLSICLSVCPPPPPPPRSLSALSLSCRHCLKPHSSLCWHSEIPRHTVTCCMVQLSYPGEFEFGLSICRSPSSDDCESEGEQQARGGRRA